MYRDLIGDPERITVRDREWWLQQFFHSDGTLKSVRLFDSAGNAICDFPSIDAAIAFAENA